MSEHEGRLVRDCNGTLPLTLADSGVVGGCNGRYQGSSSFLGVFMLQNQNALYAFDSLYKKLLLEGAKISRIMEIGTYFGGLSVFLKILALNTGAEFVTYDINAEQVLYPHLFKQLDIDFVVGDMWQNLDKIGERIASPGLSLVLCDGGNKPREVLELSRFLKSGDIIMSHDYFPSKEYYEKNNCSRFWCSPEIIDEHMRPAVEKYNLQPYMQDVFMKASWMCRRKG